MPLFGRGNVQDGKNLPCRVSIARTGSAVAGRSIAIARPVEAAPLVTPRRSAAAAGTALSARQSDRNMSEVGGAMPTPAIATVNRSLLVRTAQRHSTCRPAACIDRIGNEVGRDWRSACGRPLTTASSTEGRNVTPAYLRDEAVRDVADECSSGIGRDGVDRPRRHAPGEQLSTRSNPRDLLHGSRGLLVLRPAAGQAR